MITEDFQRTILSQYSNSFKLRGILESFNYHVDPRADIEKFFTEVFDLNTCGAYGLDVWGGIVVAPKSIRVVEPNYFGFRCTDFHPFNVKPFYNGRKSPTEITLDNEMYRSLIYFKAAANIMNTTVPEINRLLWSYFDIRGIEGECFAEYIGVMQMRVVFKFKVPYIDRAIFREYGNLLRPAGVEMYWQEYSPNTFGFFGSDLMPFGQGVFHRGNINDDFYYVKEK